MEAAQRSSAGGLARRVRALRLMAGYGAVACALPYLGLKLLWLCGDDLGVADPAMMRETSMVALNAVTAGMDLVGIAIALAFTHAWGLRIPAWILLPPIWVATGFLATFVVGLPVTALLDAVATDSLPSPSGGPVQPWVYLVVYTEFTGLGLGLILAFLLYARTRWAAKLANRTTIAPRSAAYVVQAPLANTAALMAGALSVLHLAWACGSSVGLSAEAADRRTIVSSVMNTMDAATMAGAAAGVLMTVHGIGRRAPFWLALGMTWVGSASLFAWGLWQMILVLGRTALLRSADRTALVDLAALLRLMAGLVIGVLMLLVLAERGHVQRHIALETG
jgi:hypothetical protein